MDLRAAERRDAAAIAEIWNQGIGDRIATFETELKSAELVEQMLSEGRPAVVALVDGKVKAFAWSSAYSSRPCYRGITEATIYVARDARRAGLGAAALRALLDECEARGHWKVIGKIFAENHASRELMKRFGFREVGVHEKHARLDGEWRDVVLVEKLLSG